MAALLDDPHIADTLVELPRPYREAHALAWIESHAAHRERGSEHVFALCLRDDRTAFGAATLRVADPAPERPGGRGGLGYWMGGPHRGRGFATEAVGALLAFGFDALGLDRIEALHLARNPASGRVLEKAGLVREAILAGHRRDPRTGALEDMIRWAALAPASGRDAVGTDAPRDAPTRIEPRRG